MLVIRPLGRFARACARSTARATERDVFKSKYLSVFDAILGPPTSSGLTPNSSRIFRFIEQSGFEYKGYNAAAPSLGSWYDGAQLMRAPASPRGSPAAVQPQPANVLDGSHARATDPGVPEIEEDSGDAAGGVLSTGNEFEDAVAVQHPGATGADEQPDQDGVPA